MTSIQLPWTRPPLSLNDRDHWRVKAKKVAQVRAVGVLVARQVPPTERAEVWLHYRPRDNRTRDTLNLAATLKPLTDGLVEAGALTRGDSSEYVEERCKIHKANGEPAAMWLEIKEHDDA